MDDATNAFERSRPHLKASENALRQFDGLDARIAVSVVDQLRHGETITSNYDEHITERHKSPRRRYGSAIGQ